MSESTVRSAYRWTVGGIIAFALLVSAVPAGAVSCGDTVGPSNKTVVLNKNIVGPCTDSSKPLLRVVGPVTVNLNGHAVSCRKDADGTWTRGIRIEGSKAVVKNGTVRGCDEAITLGSGHKLAHLKVKDNRRGISAGSNNTFIGNAVVRNEWGFSVDGRDNVFIDNTAFRNVWGFKFDSISDSLLVGNTSAENYFGFYFFDGERNVLIGNAATKNTGYGFLFDAGDSFKVYYNSASMNGETGFVIANGFSHDIAHNTAENNGWDGLALGSFGGPMWNMIVRENRITNNRGHGIALHCRGVLCKWNRIVSNTVHGHDGPADPFFYNATFDLFDNTQSCEPDTWDDNDFDTSSRDCIH